MEQHVERSKEATGKQAKEGAAKARPARGNRRREAAGGAAWLEWAMQANAAQLRAFSEAGQRCLEGLIALNGELADFLNAEAAKSGEFGRRLAKCDSLVDAARCCQEWTGATMESCMAESRKLAEITANVAQESWTPVIEGANAVLEGMRRPPAS